MRRQAGISTDEVYSGSRAGTGKHNRNRETQARFKSFKTSTLCNILTQYHYFHPSMTSEFFLQQWLQSSFHWILAVGPETTSHLALDCRMILWCPTWIQFYFSPAPVVSLDTWSLCAVLPSRITSKITLCWFNNSFQSISCFCFKKFIDFIPPTCWDGKCRSAWKVNTHQTKRVLYTDKSLRCKSSQLSVPLSLFLPVPHTNCD